LFLSCFFVETSGTVILDVEITNFDPNVLGKDSLVVVNKGGDFPQGGCYRVDFDGTIFIPAQVPEILRIKTSLGIARNVGS
jgi:hypothetical protein